VLSIVNICQSSARVAVGWEVGNLKTPDVTATLAYEECCWRWCSCWHFVVGSGRPLNCALPTLLSQYGPLRFNVQRRHHRMLSSAHARAVQLVRLWRLSPTSAPNHVMRQAVTHRMACAPRTLTTIITIALYFCRLISTLSRFMLQATAATIVFLSCPGSGIKIGIVYCSNVVRRPCNLPQ